MNIPKDEDEGRNHTSQDLIYDILTQGFKMDVSDIRFHAESAKPNRLIARFVSREDRGNVFRRKIEIIHPIQRCIHKRGLRTGNTGGKNSTDQSHVHCQRKG